MPEPLDGLPPADPAGSGGGAVGATGGPAAEEVLEAGAKRARPGRLRRDLLLAALLLALVAAVARAMSHSSRPDAAPTAPASTVSRSAPDSGSGLLNGSVVDVTGAPEQGPDDVGACPAAYQCLVADEPGPAAAAALAAAFPNVVLESTTTVRLLSPNFGQPLWYRQITGRFGANQVLVRVQRQRPQDLNRGGVAESEFGVITYYEGPLSKYHVVVQVTTPKGREQALPPVQKLGHDVRLLELS